MIDFEKIAQDAYHGEMDKIALSNAYKLKAYGKRIFSGAQANYKRHGYKHPVTGEKISNKAYTRGIQKGLDEFSANPSSLDYKNISDMNQRTKGFKRGVGSPFSEQLLHSFVGLNNA